MKEKVECLVLVCDNCGEHFENGNGFSIFSDEQSMMEDADNYDWIELEDKDYCPKCYTNPEDDVFVVAPSPTKK